MTLSEVGGISGTRVLLEDDSRVENPVTPTQAKTEAVATQALNQIKHETLYTLDGSKFTLIRLTISITVYIYIFVSLFQSQWAKLTAFAILACVQVGILHFSIRPVEKPVQI